jgi:hypothetical protein
MTTLILTSTTAPLFQLGQILGTPGALARCSTEHVADCLLSMITLIDGVWITAFDGLPASASRWL